MVHDSEKHHKISLLYSPDIHKISILQQFNVIQNQILVTAIVFREKSPLDRPRKGTLWGNQSIDVPLFFGGFYGLKKHIYFQHQQTTTKTQPFLCCCFNMELCGGLVFIRYATSASKFKSGTKHDIFCSIPFRRRYIFKFLKMYVFVQPFVM